MTERSDSEAASDQWIAQIAAALDVEPTVVEVGALLDLARDVAHGIERKAAPLTTFVVGYAAGAHGADSAATRSLIEQVIRMCPPPED